MKCTCRNNTMHRSFMPFELKWIINFLSTNITIHFWMNNLFMWIQCISKSKFSRTFITFKKCWLFMYDFNMFFAVSFTAKCFLAMWTWCDFPFFLLVNSFRSCWEFSEIRYTIQKLTFLPIMYLLHTYKCVQNKTLRSRSMKQNADFQEGVSQA